MHTLHVLNQNFWKKVENNTIYIHRYMMAQVLTTVWTVTHIPLGYLRVQLVHALIYHSALN